MPLSNALLPAMAVAVTACSRLAATALVVAATAAASIHSADAQALKRADGAETAIRDYGDAGGCPPTVIVSHGLGGSETGLAGLGRALAASGWRVIVMGHAESGGHVLRRAIASGDMRNRLIAAATNPDLHRARFADLDAALAEATRRCRPPRLLLAGHSMGAATTMLEAGAVARFGRFGQNRFDAYVAISPQGVGIFWAEGAWAAINKPVLMITGTNDQGADGDYTTRLPAFRSLPTGPHRLAVIDGANHFDLSGGSDRYGRTIATLIDDFVVRRPSKLPGVQVESRR